MMTASCSRLLLPLLLLLLLLLTHRRLYLTNAALNDQEACIELTSMSNEAQHPFFYVGSRYLSQTRKIQLRRDYESHVTQAIEKALPMVERKLLKETETQVLVDDKINCSNSQLLTTDFLQDVKLIWDVQASCWTDLSFISKLRLNTSQWLNMIPGVAKHIFGDKDCFHRLVQKARKSARYSQAYIEDLILRSFLFEFGSSTINERVEEYEQYIKQNHSDNRYWAIKAVDSWSGAGVQVMTSTDALQFLKAAENSSSSVVLQQYVHNPLALYGRKFDTRWWALIISLEPLTVYVLPNAYVRTAELPYSLSPESMTFRCAHLTNGEIQKQCKATCKNRARLKDWKEREYFREACSVVSRQPSAPVSIKEKAFYDLVEDFHGVKFETSFERLYNSTTRVILETILLASEDLLRYKVRTTNASSFQLLSYDIMYESESGAAKVLEINANGYLGGGIQKVGKETTTDYLRDLFSLLRSHEEIGCAAENSWKLLYCGNKTIE